MDITEFTFRLILLFIPGIIVSMIVDSLTICKKRELYEIILNSLVFGFICYLSYYLITLIPKLNLQFTFLDVLTDKDADLNFPEILIVTSLSVPVGLLFSCLDNYKILYKLARWSKISYKFGDIDVWSYLMNLKESEFEWVVVRDTEKDLMYEGCILAFSDASDGKDELFLRDVKVYINSTGEELYQIPGIYLAQDRKKLIIEFPLLKFSKFNDRKEQKDAKG